MRLVLDASITLAWCYADEASPFTESLLRRVQSDGAAVPSIWPLEVANALLVGERRGRLQEADSRTFAALLRTLPIEVDPLTRDQVFGAVLGIGRRYGLSGYDAAYVELATRQQLPLATRDERLRTAATALGLLVLT